MRTLAAANPTDPEGPELEAFIQARNAAIQPTNPQLVWQYMMGEANDIDLTVGFDTWLIYIVS